MKNNPEDIQIPSMKYRILIIIFCLAALLCSVLICLNGFQKEPEPTPDPHAGQVYLYDGYDWTWFTPRENVPLNPLKKEDFTWTDGTPVYTGSGFTVRKGFDVSEFQYSIDWSQVPAQNFDFVYLRMGRRGSTEGGIFDDLYFDRNYSGARSRGLDVGLYFFSQAISVEEAAEEANWVIDKLKNGGYRTDLPIAFDWEEQKTEDSRTKDLSGLTITDCAVAFCETIQAAGYEPCVYMNRIPAYYSFDISRLTNYKLWYALPCNPPEIIHPSFYYRFDIWQYSTTATVPGIPTETDLNYFFEPIPGAVVEPTPFLGSASAPEAAGILPQGQSGSGVPGQTLPAAAPAQTTPAQSISGSITITIA